MDKLKMQSTDRTQDAISAIGELFPHTLTEVFAGEKVDKDGSTKPKFKKAIDFDLLRQALSDRIVEDDTERYRLDWPGKKASLLRANTPITKTLRPAPAESVDWENTQNLYIEGDNLEALKILQESYLSKVKMIYIDPPYNTGNDFIYKDDFKKSRDEYEEEIGATDESGEKLFRNTDSNGRFHSDWLSMMYERLLVARDFLREDGVIFISIDENEVHNLRKICDEIFGEENFVASFIWEKKTGSSDSITIATITEYIIVYSKNSPVGLFSKNYDAYDINRYKFKDEYFEKRGPYYIDNLDRGGLQYSDSLNYGIQCPDGSIAYPNGRIEYVNDGWIWKWSKKKVDWAIKNNFLEFRKSEKKTSGWSVLYKNYLKVDNEDTPIDRGAPYKNLITSILNARSALDMKDLFNERVFQYTKPKDLICFLVKTIITSDSDIILDFFSGSATTAHAVMQLNAEDGGNRKFILVQLPEKTDEGSEAYKAGFTSIAEIGKERIRRAAKKIREDLIASQNSTGKGKSKKKAVAVEDETQLFEGEELGADSEKSVDVNQLDLGFRVFKVDSSNLKDVFYNPGALSQEALMDLTDNVKNDRTGGDLLIQVMLDLGLVLSLPIVTKKIKKNTVHFVDSNALVACFDPKMDFAIVDEIAEVSPLRVVFRDACFAEDKDRINVEERFKRLSPNTKVVVV